MLRIEISAYPTCMHLTPPLDSRRNIAMPFGTEKLEWLGYPTVKNFEDIFIRFDRMQNVTDTHTETPHDDISRGKNRLLCFLFCVCMQGIKYCAVIHKMCSDAVTRDFDCAVIKSCLCSDKNIRNK